MLFPPLFSLLSLLQFLTLVAANPARPAPPYKPDATLLGPNLQLNVSLPNALFSGRLTERPNFYDVPDASTRVTLQIAWHFGKLPQQDFNVLILRALTTIVEVLISKPAGDVSLDGDRITFRSPGCHVQVIKEDPRESSLTYGIIAAVVRGIGEVMGRWGATPAEILVVVGGQRIARVYIDLNRKPRREERRLWTS